jgi:hypothetical protein
VKRLQYDRYGGREVMRLAEFEPPRPGPDEVHVRVRAAAADALGWKMRNGEMKLLTGRSFPRAVVGTTSPELSRRSAPASPVRRPAPRYSAALGSGRRGRSPRW